MTLSESPWIKYSLDSNQHPDPLGSASNAGIFINDPSMIVNGQSTPILIYDRRFSELKEEIRELKTMVNILMQAQEVPKIVDYITLRDIPIDQAKEEIANYFKENDGREIDFDELIETLAIDPYIVVNACHSLEAEGKIG